MGDLARNHILPIAIKYQNTLLRNINFQGVQRTQTEMVNKIQEYITAIVDTVEAMTNARKIANKMGNIVDKARQYKNEVLPYFENIRYYVDHLELMVDDKLWPLPKYRELLFF